MKQLALIDADIVCFRCAATAENNTQEIAEIRVDELMRRILHDTNAIDYQAWLTGSNNFRYNIYPEYKANRKDKPRPKHLEACKEHLIKYWKAKITDGNEADDALGIEQTAYGLDSIICTIDKDLLQVPGYHYNFVKGFESFISPFEGLRHFYGQVIAGDGSDNIPSFDGKLRHQVPKFIQKLIDPLYEMTEEENMYDYCKSLYQTLDIDRNCKLLWIQRREGEIWEFPKTNQ